MEKNFNLSSLSTVYAPIEEYLKSIKSGLQENLSVVKDNGKIATDFSYIDTLTKMRSVFEMVGLNGLNKVILLVEDASKGIKEASFSTKSTIAIFEESISIIKSVEVYLKQLLDGSLDQPTRFFDKYKKLAEVIDIEVDIKDLFRPKLEVKEPKLKNELKIGQYLNKANEEEIKQGVSLATGKISTYIPVILEKVSRYNTLSDNEDMVEFKHACKVVYDALTDLQALKLSKGYYVLTGIQKLMLCICAPFFNENFNALAVSNLPSMKLNLSLIEDTAIKMNEGISKLQLGKKTSIKINEEVVTENLFFVINAIIQNQKLKEMPVYKELDAYFAYEFYEEQLSSETIQATITYQNTGLSDQLEEILFNIKEELVVITGKKHNEDAYSQHLSKFYVLHYKFWEVLKIANGELNFKSFANALVELTEKMKSKKVSITEEVKKEISISVVWLEYAINNLIKKRIEQKVRVEFEKQIDVQEKRIRNLSAGISLAGLAVPVLDARSKEQEARKAVLKIFEEVEKDLKIAEETLDGILQSKSLEDRDLDSVLKPLNSIKGILLVLGNRDMGELVKELVRIWKCVQQNGLDSIPEEELKKSVVWFAGLSLFVTASRDNNEHKSKEIEAKLILEFKGTPEKVAVKAAELVIPENNFKQEEILLDSNVEDVSNLNAEKIEKVLAEDIPAPSEEELSSVVIYTLEETVQQGEPVIESIVENVAEIKIESKGSDLSVENVDMDSRDSNFEYETSVAEDDELKSIFVEEVEGLAQNCLDSLNKLDSNPNDTVEAITVRRVFHTYKGSGRMIGVENLGEVAWTAEQEMNKIVSAKEVNISHAQIHALRVLNNKFMAWSKTLDETGEVTISIAKEQQEFLQNFHAGKIEEVTNVEQSQAEVFSLIEPTYEEKEEVIVPKIETEGLSLSEPTYEEKEEVVVPKIETDGLVLSDITYEKEAVSSAEEKNNISFHTDEVITLVEPTYEEKEEEVISLKTPDVSLEDLVPSLNADDAEEIIVPKIYDETEEEETISLNLNDFVENDDNDIALVVPQIVDDEEEQIEAPVLEEVSLEDEILKGVVVTKSTNDIQEIDEDELYTLCQIEIQDNLNKLEDVTKGSNIDAGQQYEFMRFAHTLSSLGKTINLENMAEVAHKIEVIGEVMLEKNKSLDDANMLEVRNVVNGLREQSTKYNEPTEKDLQKYLLALAKVKSSLTDVSGENSSDELLKRLTEVEEKINKGLEFEAPVFKAEEISLPSEIKDLPQKFEELAQKVAENTQSIQTINREIENINESLEELKEKTSRIKSEAIGRLKDLKKEFATFKEPVKKKSNGSVVWIFQKITVRNENLLNGIEERVENILSHLVDVEFSDDEKNELVQSFESLELNIEFTLLSLDNLTENLDIASNSEKEEEAISLEIKNLSWSENMDTNNNNNIEVLPSIVNTQKSTELVNIYSDPIVIDIFEEKISDITDEFEEEIFLIAKDEIEEKKQQIYEILDNTESDNLDKEVNSEIKRHLHTLKGNLRMAGLNKMGAIAHRLESLLDFAENRDLPLLVVKPILENELVKLKYLENNLTELSKEKEIWINTLENTMVVANEGNELIVSNNTSKVEITPIQVIKQDEKQAHVKMSAKTLDNLFNDAGEMRLSRITIEGTLANNKKHMADMRAAAKKMSSLLRELEIQAETQIAAKKSMEAELGDGFDPLEFDRYTRLQELTRFMNEALADVEDGLVDLGVVQKIQENTILQQAIVTNNILDSIMHVRLVSVDTINDRLYRISRNTAKDLGKLVRLDIVGERTEIDRFVLEKMFDPLAHILRNCIAHGIEAVDVREDQNKEKVGAITLDIKQEGNFIVMTISDDGAGIDLDKVREKGIEKGLLRADQIVSDDDIVDLIYRSGFSTADSISQVAGRGVGMDVVKSEILSLGGNIKTTTKKGEGSTFRIVLPVSVATNQVLISTTLGKLIAIPAILVENVISVKEAEMMLAYKTNKIKVGNSLLNLSYMGHLSGVLAHNKVPKLNPYNTIVVVGQGEDKIAVHLDRLETTEEILIKPVGPYFSKIKGLLGATLLGDGRQGLVVNPLLLRDHYNEMLMSDSSKLESKIESVIRVMVVDDANTVRRTTEKILKKHGFEVVLAVDGSNALEILQEIKPDIILSDIEMPVMNGFELLKNLKISDTLKQIPIIMITSRTADKHRQMAFDLGCDGFLGKPYIEEELIENIFALVKR